MKNFKIVRAFDGKTMMATEYESCVYDDDTIRSMMKNGYKAYMDGRVYRPSDGGKRNDSGRTNRKAVR